MRIVNDGIMDNCNKVYIFVFHLFIIPKYGIYIMVWNSNSISNIYLSLTYS